MILRFNPDGRPGTIDNTELEIKSLIQVAPSEIIVESTFGETKINRHGGSIHVRNENQQFELIGVIENRNELESLFLNWADLPIRINQ